MKRTVAFILSVVLVLAMSAAIMSVAADDYVVSPEHPDYTTETEAVVTETETNAPETPKKGCGSVISGGILVAVIPAALMFIGRKRED